MPRRALAADWLAGWLLESIARWVGEERYYRFPFIFSDFSVSRGRIERVCAGVAGAGGVGVSQHQRGFNVAFYLKT